MHSLSVKELLHFIPQHVMSSGPLHFWINKAWNQVLTVPCCRKAAVTRPGAYVNKAVSGPRWPPSVQSPRICPPFPNPRQVDDDDNDDDVCDHPSHLDSLRRQREKAETRKMFISFITQSKMYLVCVLHTDKQNKPSVFNLWHSARRYCKISLLKCNYVHQWVKVQPHGLTTTAILLHTPSPAAVH